MRMAKRSSRKKATTSSTGSKPKSTNEPADSGSRPMARNEPPPDPMESITRLHVWQIQAVRDLLLVAAAIAIFWSGYALRAVTVPLLVALLLAYLFEPLIRKMCKHPKISRAGAVTTLLVSVGGLFIIALSLSLPLIVGQSIQFVDDIRNGVMRQRIFKLEPWMPSGVQDEFKSLVERLPNGRRPAPAHSPATQPLAQDSPPESATETDESETPADPPTMAGADPQLEEVIAQRVSDQLAPIRDELELLRNRVDRTPPAEADTTDEWGIIRRTANTVTDILGTLIGLGLLAFLIPFYFFFFSLWYPDVIKFADTLLPEKNRERTLELLTKMDTVVAGFVRGRIVISIIMGALLAIGWMVCGVPYAIPLGLLVGVFCAVPYLGGIGIPIAVALLLFEQLGLDPEDRNIWWGWIGVLLWPTLWFAIVQTIEGYVLTPMIAGKATKLDPVTIVVVVLAGGSVMGVYGMLLAIPVAACGKIFIMEVLLPKITAWTRGEIADPLPIERD